MALIGIIILWFILWSLSILFIVNFKIYYFYLYLNRKYFINLSSFYNKIIGSYVVCLSFIIFSNFLRSQKLKTNDQIQERKYFWILKTIWDIFLNLFFSFFSTLLHFICFSTLLHFFNLREKLFHVNQCEYLRINTDLLIDNLYLHY